MLQPKFIKDIDRYLLLKFPVIWSSRILYVAWYTVLCWISMTLISLVLPSKDIDMGFLEFYSLLVSLVCLGGLIVWLVFLARHNSMKQYGDRTFGREWVSVLCNYTCIVLISSVLFMLPVIAVLKAHIAIQSHGLVEKVNILNINRPFFPKSDGYGIENGGEKYKLFSDYVNYNEWYGDDDYKYIDNDLLTEEEAIGAFGKIRGREKIDKACRDYLNVAKELGITYGFDEARIPTLIDDTLVYKRNAAFEVSNQLLHNELYVKTGSYFKVIRKFDFLFEYMFYYGWLLISVPILLIFITLFRNLDRIFALASIGITILLVIVNALVVFLVLKDDFSTKSTIEFLMFFFGAWTLVLGIVSTNVFFQRSYSRVSAYCVFLFNLAMPALPIIFASLILGHREYNLYFGYNDGTQWEHWMKYAHIGGLLLFLAMQQIFFKRLYERLWALPK